MKSIILEHLLKHGSITSWDAIQMYGCTRLSQYIYLLKKDGFKFADERVKGKNRYGHRTNFVRYILVK